MPRSCRPCHAAIPISRRLWWRRSLPTGCSVKHRSQRGDTTMFIAMNRFRVKRGAEAAFEKVWLNRDSYLDRVPGFVEFHLLKGPEAEDHTLYASHTVWQSKAAFEGWTKSEEFRAAHARAGNDSTGPLYLEHPKFEGFEVRQTISPKAAVAYEVPTRLAP